MRDPAVTMVGIDHATTPVDLRERISPAWEPAADALSPQGQGLALATCLRSEAYVLCSDPQASRARLVDALSQASGSDPAAVMDAVTVRTGRPAVEHLFSVAAGLESAIVGERQILDQVRGTWNAARAARALDPRLDRLFQHAVAAGRRVRRETTIGQGRASLAGTAADLAAAAVDLRAATAVILGAGTVARSTALALAGRGATRFIVVSRSPESRERLARDLRARGARCDTRPSRALAAGTVGGDLIVCATASAGHVLGPGELPAGPVFVLDLASPRDVDPAAATLPHVRLADLEAVWAEVRRAQRIPPGEVAQARAIVSGMAASYMDWLAERAAGPAIAELRAEARRVDRGEPAQVLHRRTLALKHLARATAPTR